MNNIARYFPWVCLVLALGGLIVVAVPRSDPEGQLQIHEFGRLPVLHDGRVKPLDSLARQVLYIISSRYTFGEHRGPQQSATRWLLDTMSHRWSDDEPALKHKVLRIDNQEVLRTFGLEYRAQFLRYSIGELVSKGKMEVLQEEVARVRNLREQGKPLDLYDSKIMDLVQHFEMLAQLLQGIEPAAVAPVGAQSEWQTVSDGLENQRLTGRSDSALTAFTAMLEAHGRNDVAVFNRALAAYRDLVEERLPDVAYWASVETWFNEADLFSYCMWVYWAAVLFGCAGWLGWARPLNQTAVLLAALALAVHTTALLTRMYLQGRPPVTNLYSTAIFIGWGCMILGLMLEWMYGTGIGTVAGAIVAVLTLHLAPILGGTSDTLGNLVAVLNTQFWLATHVTIINIGYAATFMAGVLGCLFILRGVFSTSLDRTAEKTMGRMIYGVTCFAIFCSFIGTVLGGIWADQSWGRFWGWDPKENGALLIVLMNAIVLHARWCGWAKERGVALLSIFSNFITGWSWFGTNQLGVGLHAYGFSQELVTVLRWFWGSQTLFFLIGCLPMSHWRSRAVQPESPRPQPARRPGRSVPLPAGNR